MPEPLEKISRFTLYAFACLCWATIPIALFLVFEPVPLEVKYVSPAFIREPSDSRPDPSQYVYETAGGVTLYRYLEVCVSRPFSGTAHRSWVYKAFIWHAPDLPTVMSRYPGCRSQSVAVDIPTTTPSRDFQFVQTMDIDVNILRNAKIDFAPIPLRVLSPEDSEPMSRKPAKR